MLQDKNYRVIEITRNELDFTDKDIEEKVSTLLDYYRPDVIINAAGYLGDNTEGSQPTLAINVESNWAIIRYFIDAKESYNPVRFIMVGSSAYREGKKQYMMYSASKAALHNLWQGAVDYFANTNITVDMIHPVRTRTKMTLNRFADHLDYFEPEEVAEEILKLVESPSKISRCVYLTFENKK
jgi:NAD(P)-dependent dehydrogenase (short-subunit alcohol dehydrogenase family)